MAYREDILDDIDRHYKPIVVRPLTNKIRKLRDHFIENGIDVAPPRVLPNHIAQALKNVGRTPSGDFSAKLIQQYIDSAPSQRYNWSEGSYDFLPMPEAYKHRWGKFTPREWAQRHSDEPSKVFRLHVNNEQIQQLKQAGVYDTFVSMDKLASESGHPVAPGTIGWVRWTGDKTGIHTDEVQTDYSRRWSDFIREELDDLHSAGQFTDGQHQMYLAHYAKTFPDEHQAVIQKILFGNHQPAEVLHEAFHQYARENGFVGTPIHVWTPESKAKLGKLDTDRPLPKHFHSSYRDIPKKLGIVDEGKYGEIPTQNNPQYTGDSTIKDQIRKTETAVERLVAQLSTSSSSSSLHGKSS